jgi:hypothetical protein
VAAVGTGPPFVFGKRWGKFALHRAAPGKIAQMKTLGFFAYLQSTDLLVQAPRLAPDQGADAGPSRGHALKKDPKTVLLEHGPPATAIESGLAWTGCLPCTIMAHHPRCYRRLRLLPLERRKPPPDVGKATGTVASLVQS